MFVCSVLFWEQIGKRLGKDLNITLVTPSAICYNKFGGNATACEDVLIFERRINIK